MYKQITTELFDFIDKSPSCYHTIENIRNDLLKAGFSELSEGKSWNIEKGGKYFTVRNYSSVIAFRVPETDYKGFNIVSSHSDSPTFKVKELSEMKVEANYTKLNVETYGGMIMSTWLDRPLSIAGRVIVKTEKGIKTVLVDVDKDLCVIPNLAIHMQRQVNEYSPAF